VAAGKDSQVYAIAEKLAEDIEAAGMRVLLDDREKVSPGVKFADAELLGMPRVLVVGKGIEAGEVEIWNRRSGERRSVRLESALAELISH
jgi:prolyl-tRNA synthetase